MADVIRRERGYTKSRLTKQVNKIEQYCKGQAQMTKGEIEARAEKLTEIYDEFLRINNRLAEELGGLASLTEADESEFDEFENKYLRTNGWVKTHLSEMETAIQRQPQDTILARVMEQQTELIRTIANQSSAPASTSRQSNKIRLPTINLPNFDGRVEDWPRFRDMFTSIIKDTEITDTSKLQYLVGALKGNAAKTIECIPISEDNFEIAWNLLTKRFEDKKELKRAHIKALFQIPPVQKESAGKLQELIDAFSQHVRVLESLKVPVKSWCEMLLYMLEERLDFKTRRDWEESNEEEGDGERTYGKAIEFIKRRIKTLIRTNKIAETAKEKPQYRENVYKSTNVNKYDNKHTFAVTKTSGSCFACGEPHPIYTCQKFLKLTIPERVKEVERLQLCTNCLRNDHNVKNCRAGPCRICKKRHNTLCHEADHATMQNRRSTADDATMQNRTSTSGTQDAAATRTSAVLHAASATTGSPQVALTTAIVNAKHSNGSIVQLRALIDSASEANLISQTACNKLGLKSIPTRESVTFVNEVTCELSGACQVNVESRLSNFTINMFCIISPRISSRLPSTPINESSISIPQNLNLADPIYYKSSPIDLLIGGEFFLKILEMEQVHLGDGLPILQNSKLGWLISGPIPRDNPRNHQPRTNDVSSQCFYIQGNSLHDTLSRFWEIEEYASRGNFLSKEESDCESNFNNNASRDESGRFIVKLPFRDNKHQLGESRKIAERRFLYLEKKFTSNPLFRERYCEFMREYIQLGHMTIVNSESPSNQRVYLPHHGVLRESSTTTKLRVVFDASAKTSTGVALNETLMVGPKLQDDLIDILLRFRFPSIVITADLEKMYRQILIHESDRDYQRILWRFSKDEPISEYKLNTVTYGQACAPFLAIRSVRELATKEANNYKQASEILLNDLYVDDLLTGTDDETVAITLVDDFTALLKKGGFNIHKWRSNKPSIFNFNEPNKICQESQPIGEEATTKTLGIEWEPTSDEFLFSIQPFAQVLTKREMLSAISRIFDPLGLIGPSVLQAKFLLQKLWREKCDWDEKIPIELQVEWEKYTTKSHLIRIPRRVVAINSKVINIHAFCDASERAYGTCIYIQSIDEFKNSRMMLLCAKSKLAPLKRVTIPRLELCAAVTLARTLKNVKRTTRVPINEIYAWSDSTIVLSWIKGEVSRQKTFVANRVSEIQSVLPAVSWRHVKSEDNPADLISRGLEFEELKSCNLWWNGPQYLNGVITDLSFDNETENADLSVEDMKIVQEELKSESTTFFVTKSNETIDRIFTRISSLTKLERVLAWILRVSKQSGLESVRLRELTIEEVTRARTLIIKYVQAKHFRAEIDDLKNKKPICKNSKLLSLTPVLDQNGVLRVGGRLQNSNLEYNKKHPILLPAKCKLTSMIIRDEHIRLCHAGPQFLLYSLRETYWILNGRSVTKRIFHECVKCYRSNPRTCNQIMGNLPTTRVIPTHPFYTVGIDFAGPISTLQHKGRGRKVLKSYICLFICLATKAIHLELVSDLTTAAFLAALRRFISRRGIPKKIKSDNGTNFKGAQREIGAVYEFLIEQTSIRNFFLSQKIEWSFIPPYSPHLGGIWEAGIKSCKSNLKRVIGDSLLTFEELTTILTQIEACLNSRPLSYLPSQPDDLQPLTPGHFLIGRPLINLPEHDLGNERINRLDRWQLTQRITQDFWKRWSLEYLTSLQSRQKWQTEKENLAIDNVVLIKDINLPPLQWKLGKVVEVHPDKENKIRIVSLKTANGITKRAITKVCKLPMCDDVNDIL